MPTLAHWLLLSHSLSVLSREAEDPFSASTLQTQTMDLPLEVPFFGTCVMLDGQLKRYDPATIAFEHGEEMVVIWVALSDDAPFRKSLQV